MANAEWRMPNGECPMANAQWRIPNGEYPMANAQWRMPNAEWRMPKRQMANGEPESTEGGGELASQLIVGVDCERGLGMRARLREAAKLRFDVREV
jgi:hypothetical protein